MKTGQEESGMGRCLGIIDLGSNTVRLMVVRIHPSGAFHVADTAKAGVRLAASVEDDGSINEDGLMKTVSALRHFRAVGRAHGVTEYFAVATAAVRQAPNGVAFAEELAARTGIPVRIISGVEESELAFLGAINTLAETDGLLVDVGGASTELVRFSDRRIVASASLPFGAVNLTARFSPEGRQSARGLAGLRAFVEQQLDSIPWVDGGKGLPIIGVGGTVRAMARIDRRNRSYPFDILHNYRMAPDQVAGVCKRILETNPSDLLELPGVDAERIDVIGAGAVLVAEVVAKTGAREMLVSGAGLREGLLYRHLLADRSTPLLSEVLEFSIANLVRLHGLKEERSLTITDVALILFDGLAHIHRLGKSPRRCLKAAAALSEAGRVINHYGEYQNAFFLLTRSRLYGLSHRELLIAGAASAFEGARKVKELLRPYASILTPGDLSAARKLGVITALSRMIAIEPPSRTPWISFRAGDVRIDVGEPELPPAWLDGVRALSGDFKKAFGVTLEMG